MFEILEVEPFTPGNLIESQVNLKFPNRITEYEKSFEYLKQKNYHDQYYKFGYIIDTLKENDIDDRNATSLVKYVVFLIIILVFLGEDLPTSKRICFIFTILTCIYEGGLYSNIQERDLILDMFPKYFWLFEIVKYLHCFYIFTFMFVAGFGAIQTEYDSDADVGKKNALLRIVAENQSKISSYIKQINDDRTSNLVHEELK